MEFIIENTNLLITIVIFIVCVIIGYFADKKLKLDEIIDKKMKDIDKNVPKKEDKKSSVVKPQPSIQVNKQSNIGQPTIQNNVQPNVNSQTVSNNLNNSFNQNINNNNINGPILTSENIIEEEINNIF